MIYQVAPRDDGEDLYKMLSEHYRDDPNVTVIVDRRSSDRRGRRKGTTDSEQSDAGAEQRQVRDRRRARVAGEVSSVSTFKG